MDHAGKRHGDGQAVCGQMSSLDLLGAQPGTTFQNVRAGRRCRKTHGPNNWTLSGILKGGVEEDSEGKDVTGAGQGRKLPTMAREKPGEKSHERH